MHLKSLDAPDNQIVPRVSPQSIWPAAGCQERNWGTSGQLEIFPQNFCGKTMQAITGQPIIKTFEIHRVFPGDHRCLIKVVKLQQNTCSGFAT